MQILIVEDDLLIAEMLSEMLAELGHQTVAVCSNYTEALVVINNNTIIDFCFLDINLGESKTGIDIAKHISGKIHFAFLTSYSDKNTISNAMQYAPEAYLFKPFSEIDLYTTLELVKVKKQLVSENANPTIVIKDAGQAIKIKESDILWLKADNVYLELKTINKVYLIRTSIIKFMEQYPLQALVRTHRTFAVNVNHVNAVAGQFMYIGNEKIPISRKHKEELFQKFNH
jgi:two-component system, LytTR family, response regulator LytT